MTHLVSVLAALAWAACTPEAPPSVVPQVVPAPLASDSLAALERCRAGLAALASADSPEAEAAAMDSVGSLHHSLATDAQTGFEVWPLRIAPLDGEPVGRSSHVRLAACGERVEHRVLDTGNLWRLMRE